MESIVSFSDDIRNNYLTLQTYPVKDTKRVAGIVDDLPIEFPDEYDDAQKPNHILRADVALAAMSLDASGAKLDQFVDGITVLYAPTTLFDPIRTILGFLLQPREIRSQRSYSATKKFDVFWCTSSLDDSTLIDAIQRGMPIIDVEFTDSKSTDDVIAIADRKIRLSAVTAALVSNLLSIMYGDDITLPKHDYKIENILKAVRPGIGGRRAADHLLKLSGLSDSDGSSDSVDDSDDTPTAVPLAEVAEKVVVRLRDLAGYGAAKDWGLQLAADLADYKAGRLAWDDVDKGMLLSGPPGCGKTFFVSALPAECGVPLIQSSYSDWENATGSGNLISKSIKKIFADARKEAPCIMFIDEIDTMGVCGDSHHNSSWFASIVNTLLPELDGAEPRDGVIVIGATNHPEKVDPALLRPGRLDRHVEISRPSIADLPGILAHHIGKIDGIDRAARACRGMSAADIAQVARDARRRARKLKKSVTAGDVMEVAGDRRPSRTQDLDRLVCVHEAGHALAAVKLGIQLDSVDVDENCTTVESMLGSVTGADIENKIVFLLAGRAVEIVVLGGPSHGASSDLMQATKAAASAISAGGLDGSLLSLDPSAAMTLEETRDRVEAILVAAAERAQTLITANRPALDALAAALRSERYLDTAEVKVIVDQGCKPPKVRTAGLRRLPTPVVDGSVATNMGGQQ
jgi:SpoVK/Ycf46/Vps4 family AAA+-type ATPase